MHRVVTKSTACVSGPEVSIGRIPVIIRIGPAVLITVGRITSVSIAIPGIVSPAVVVISIQIRLATHPEKDEKTGDPKD